MVRVLSVTLLVLVAVAAVMAQGHDFKYPEREVVAELAAQILRVVGGSWPPATGLHKRNSELINSMLGLPKVMNDAGRR